MKEFTLFKTSPVYIDIGLGSLKAFKDGKAIDISLERGADARLTAACREKITSGLRAFVNKKSFQPRSRAFCAINAMGVSVRRLSLPVSSNEEFDSVLRLQIEAEFPLSPDELAWGYFKLPPKSPAKRELLVAAVKREVVEDYIGVLTAAGLEPVFTLAALARNLLCPQPGDAHALLDASGDRPEWGVFEEGIPTSLRMLPATKEIPVTDSVAKVVNGNPTGRKIYLTGAGDDLASQLSRRLGGNFLCVPLPVEGAASAAILGLKKAVEQDAVASLMPLQVRVKRAAGFFNASQRELKPWLIRATALLLLLLILPYAEAILLKPLLTRKLDALKADKSRLTMIDHELDFLQSLKQTQPPYLDALFVMAKSAPSNTRFDSLGLDRHGDIAMHGMMQNGTQVTDFRAKLIASGFFSSVTVEEQTPTPDRQHVNVRMSAHWKPFEGRVGLAIGPTPEEIMQAKTNHDDVGAGGGGGFPGGMMMFGQ